MDLFLSGRCHSRDGAEGLHPSWARIRMPYPGGPRKKEVRICRNGKYNIIVHLFILQLTLCCFQLLAFMYGWLTFYHQGHEVAKDFNPHMLELQSRIQKVTRITIRTRSVTHMMSCVFPCRPEKTSMPVERTSML